MRTNDELVDYVDNLRKEQNISINELARRTGLAKSSLSRYFNKTRGFPVNKVNLFAKALHVKPEDILGVTIDGSTQNPPASNMEYLYNSDTVVMQVPLLGEIACGDPITAEENIEDYIPETYQKDNVPSGTLFALKAKGHSMEPTIPDGSTVIVRQQPSVEDGEIAAVLVDDETRATLKRVKHSNGVVMLQPDNRDFDPIVLTPSFPGKILGKAIKVEYPL